MRIVRKPYQGRLISLAVDRRRILINYGDLVSLLPSAWADALPHALRVPLAGQVYADPAHLRALTKTDRVDTQARKQLARVLDELPTLTESA